MASKFLGLTTFCYFLLVSPLLISITIAQQVFSRQLPLSMLKPGSENVTHLHFYFHDIVSGKNPTAVQIAAPSTPYPTAFGLTVMADDPLTVGPDRGSEEVGHAQGLYAGACQKELALLMVMNYVFTKGEYNGSSIAVLGRNPPMQDVREMPIVGGTGIFRFARGYALAHTVWASPQGDATIEYNVYVYHDL